jgi:hypothetical protein
MPRSKSKKKDKIIPDNLKDIIELRNEKQTNLDTQEKNQVGMLCKGMYKCSKDNDKKCLDDIKDALNNYEPSKKSKKESSKSVKGGGSKRSRSKSKKRSKSKSKK